MLMIYEMSHRLYCRLCIVTLQSPLRFNGQQAYLHPCISRHSILIAGKHVLRGVIIMK